VLTSFLTAAIAASPVSTSALSISASCCYALAIRETHEGNYLEAGQVLGLRGQYDWRLGSHFFAGPVVGYDGVYSSQGFPPPAHVALAGAAIGWRWGNVVRGGLRLASGGALAFVRRGSETVTAPGWFLDVEGELAVRLGGVERWELFLDVPIFTSRTFYSRRVTSPGKWTYAVPLIPFSASIGLRRMF
jgi:hypothetical protein